MTGQSQLLQTISPAAILGFAWILRFFLNSPGIYKDARAVFLIYCLLNSHSISRLIRNSQAQFSTPAILVTLTTAFGLTLYFFWRTPSRHQYCSEAVQKEDSLLFLKPCMIPCRTTHSRLFPTKHSFSYSYLYVGIPVGWRGAAGSILSADNNITSIMPQRAAKTWYGVVADDYLQRGDHEQGLQGKLRDYLTSQNIPPGKYPHAYLVTAPRFLGFSFNPVSFWYLYDKTHTLGAMILEVNNTFDERRMYFMDRRAASTRLGGLEIRFVQEWPKDFHVSPFNDRGGVYSVQSIDPFNSRTEDLHKIDNTIVLKSDEGKPKIVARVFSTEPTMDARTMNAWHTLIFVLRWWWVGFMTKPRILKEAKSLWLKKLEVYYRPEVLSTSIGRNETHDERRLEPFFKSFLEQMATSEHIEISYMAAAGPTRGKWNEIRPAHADHQHRDVKRSEIRVLTPAFYSQLVHYNLMQDAFDRHYFNAREGEAMIQCTCPETLRLCMANFSASLRSSSVTPIASTASYLTIGPHLRPLWRFFVMIFKDGKLPMRVGPPSDLELSVLGSSKHVRRYFKAVYRVLLTDRIGFGLNSVLQLEELCIWSFLVLAAALESSLLFGKGEINLKEGKLVLCTVLTPLGLHLLSLWLS